MQPGLTYDGRKSEHSTHQLGGLRRSTCSIKVYIHDCSRIARDLFTRISAGVWGQHFPGRAGPSLQDGLDSVALALS